MEACLQVELQLRSYEINRHGRKRTSWLEQKQPSGLGHMQDAVSFIDQHAGRCGDLKSLPVLKTIVGFWVAVVACQGWNLRDAGTRDHTGQRRQFTRPPHHLENASVAVDGPKQALALDALGGADEQIAIVAERVEECGANLALQVAVEI